MSLQFATVEIPYLFFLQASTYAITMMETGRYNMNCVSTEHTKVQSRILRNSETKWNETIK